MGIFEIISVLITLTAAFAYINHRYVKLPASIGILIVSLFASFVIMAINHFFKGALHIEEMLGMIDFNKALMGSMLSFLLFAGAIHVPISELKANRLPIIIFSTVSVVLSTFFIGGALFYILPYFGYPIDFIYCLLFGSLISPTDPIAVLGVLKEAKIPASLETKIAGESLFNDGVAVVVFTTIYHVAASPTGEFDLGHSLLLFLEEAGGGILFGIALGYVGYYLLKSIDEYKVEVLITLAIVMGGYALAAYLHISGPLAMVASGLIIGNLAKRDAWSDITADYVEKFWELVDEILNAFLFVLIGLELLIIETPNHLVTLAAMIIALILIGRFVALWFPAKIISLKEKITTNTVLILVWGGLRGGLSLAMVLSLTEEMHRDLFLYLAYVVVLFTIIVQGLTIKKVVAYLRD